MKKKFLFVEVDYEDEDNLAILSLSIGKFTIAFALDSLESEVET